MKFEEVSRHANASPVQLCGAFCPAAKTVVFNGSQIDQAVAANGARYADLDNAFAYRQKIVEGCTCNGKDSFGLARIDVANDPTLRQGDIVASGDNVKAALIAMAAAKERGAGREQPVSEKPSVRNGLVKRLAGPISLHRNSIGSASSSWSLRPINTPHHSSVSCSPMPLMALRS